ncbi:MAG: pirin family protein [Plesiomonas sp.]|uniref:pirin family protein n=1 Tax=Plesiomonas sp. TaxID=2486279 RepID=UPI003EE6DB6B
MLHLRQSDLRGHDNHGWLQTWHSFSFADYFDPNYMGFSALRVINEDIVAPRSGFPTHPHKDMEILTYVRQGRIAHKDSMGNVTEVQAGEFQIMSAGTGIRHSEYNPSDSTPLHLFQIWILPQQHGLEPRYAQQHFVPQRGKQLILSPDGRSDSLQVFQDMTLWRWVLTAHEQADYRIAERRHIWIQLISGDIEVNGQRLQHSDGLAVWEEQALQISAHSESEFLLFDLA